MRSLQIATRPAARYRPDGTRNHGCQRTEGRWSRTLALFDRLGIRKRPVEMQVMLSIDGYAALTARAAALHVHPSGLVAYLVEVAVREAS